jgi:hypothetical protein
MSELVPELAGLPAGCVFDGELIAFGRDGLPSFPRLCERMLAGRMEIPVMFVCFDLLAEDGDPLLGLPYRDRRRRGGSPNIPFFVFTSAAHQAGIALRGASRRRPSKPRSHTPTPTDQRRHRSATVVPSGARSTGSASRRRAPLAVEQAEQ